VVSQVCRSCLHISTANEDYDQDLELADILVLAVAEMGTLAGTVTVLLTRVPYVLSQPLIISELIW